MQPGIESSKNYRYLMQSMQMADPDLPVAGESPVLDWLPEACGRLLQDLLKVLRKGHVIEEEDRSRLDGVVAEGLVKDRSLQLKLLGKEVEHRPAGIGLFPFPEFPGMATWRPWVFTTDCEATGSTRHSATTLSPIWSPWKTSRTNATGSPERRTSACEASESGSGKVLLYRIKENKKIKI
jgi:hypothetical protein